MHTQGKTWEGYYYYFVDWELRQGHIGEILKLDPNWTTEQLKRTKEELGCPGQKKRSKINCTSEAIKLLRHFHFDLNRYLGLGSV